MKALIETRVATLRELYQHELMIIKLMNDICWQEKQEEEEKAVEKRLGELELKKDESYLQTVEFKKAAESYTKQYDHLMAEEKFGER